MSKKLNKKKTSVQFDVVNTTSSPITLNLFDSNTLTQTPTPENTTFSPANTRIGQTSPTLFSSRFNAVSQVSGNVYITTDNFPLVQVYDADGVFITNIATPNNTRYIVYNSATDEMICTSINTELYKIDCATNSLVGTYTLLGAGFINQISIDTFRGRIICPRSTGALTIASINFTGQTSYGLPFGGQSAGKSAYDSDSDLYWFVTTANALWEWNPNTTTATIKPAVAEDNAFNLIYLQGTNRLYTSGNILASYFVIDTLTGTNLTTIPASGNSISIAIDQANGLIYIPKFTNFIEVYDLNTNTLLNTINNGHFIGQGISFSAINNRMYFSQINASETSIFTTIPYTTSNFYIGGSSDYNFFLQSILDEPIKLDCLNIISNNQDQLNNPITISKNDADGHSNQYPEFPLLDVSAWQQQGNRSSIPMGGIILDGRTFFSNYVINPNETVILELCYEQLNRFAFTKHPELFSSLKPISEEQKEKIEDRIIQRDKEESGEKESKFEIIKDTLVIDITITNNTTSISNFNLFEANQNELVVNTPSVTFANIGDYNYLVQQLRDSPLVINSIEVICSEQNQLTIPISVQTKDANGDSITYQHFPVNTVSIYQQQGNRALFKTNHLILDGYTTFANYNILPNTTISMVIYYKQFKRSLFLKNHVFTKLKKPIFNNGMGFAEEIEYFNEVTENANNKKIVNHLEKSINFGDEQVYSFGFDGSRKDNSFVTSEKKDIINQDQSNQSIFNYRDVFNKLHGNSGNKKIFE